MALARRERDRSTFFGLLLISREPAFLRACISWFADAQYNELVGHSRPRILIPQRLKPPNEAQPHDALVVCAIYWILAQIAVGGAIPPSPLRTSDGREYVYSTKPTADVITCVRHSIVALLHPNGVASGNDDDNDAFADPRRVVQVCTLAQRFSLYFPDTPKAPI